MDNLFLFIAVVSIPTAFVFAGIAVVNYIRKNKEKGKKSLKISGISLVVTIVAFIAFGVISDNKEPEKVEVSGPAKEVVDKVEKEPELTVEENATEEKEEDGSADPKSQIENIVSDKLKGKTNTDKERIVSVEKVSGENEPLYFVVTLNSSENLTTDMTKRTMWLDSKDILEPISKIENMGKIILHWQLPLTDTLGNVDDVRVMTINLEKKILDEINWENFDVANFAVISESYFEHPAFKK
ncbi:hypothetical protein [Sporosarcina sp. FSL K6-1508]|uniref:hypothetical protein n=1 Tax=Sporosarcina sp. FSL K6-1508 TaxID=2921553 RepID=UPI0030F8B674